MRGREAKQWNIRRQAVEVAPLACEQGKVAAAVTHRAMWSQSEARDVQRATTVQGMGAYTLRRERNGWDSA